MATGRTGEARGESDVTLGVIPVLHPACLEKTIEPGTGEAGHPHGMTGAGITTTLMYSF